MLVMGTNRWEIDIPKDMLVNQSLQFAEDVNSAAGDQVKPFHLIFDKKLLWCTWETDNLGGLKAAFAEMNKQSGLISELAPVEDMYDK